MRVASLYWSRSAAAQVRERDQPHRWRAQRPGSRPDRVLTSRATARGAARVRSRPKIGTITDRWRSWQSGTSRTGLATTPSPVPAHAGDGYTARRRRAGRSSSKARPESAPWSAIAAPTRRRDRRRFREVGLIRRIHDAVEHCPALRRSRRARTSATRGRPSPRIPTIACLPSASISAAIAGPRARRRDRDGRCYRRPPASARCSDRQHAALLGDRLDRPYLGARLRPSRADAVCAKSCSAAAARSGSSSGVGDIDLDAGRCRSAPVALTSSAALPRLASGRATPSPRSATGGRRSATFVF